MIDDGDGNEQEGELSTGEGNRAIFCGDGAAIFGEELIQPGQRSLGRYGTVWDGMGRYGTVWDGMGRYGVRS